MLWAKQSRHNNAPVNSTSPSILAKICRLLTCYSHVIVTSMLVLNSTNAAEIYTTETLSIEHRSPLLNIFSFSRPDFSLNSHNGAFHWRSRLEVVNYISATHKDNDILILDGETLLIENAIQYQLNQQLQLKVTLPWMTHHDGFLDRFIYAFHNILQLPQNGRTEDRHNEMLWALYSNNQEIISSTSASQGIGDVRINISWTPPEAANIQLSGLLKVPSGNIEKFTGSEQIDAGFSYLHQNPNWFADRSYLIDTALSLWYGAGFTFIGKTKLYDNFQQRAGTFTARVGSGWLVKPDWQIKMQFDTNSPLFKTKIRELGWYPVQLSFSSVHTINDKTAFDFVIVEDLRPRSAPDVIFSFGLKLKL